MKAPVVKICGITRPQDATMAADAGADWLGLNYWPQSKRSVNRERGLEIAAAARVANPAIVLVGVFVNQRLEGVREIADEVGLDYVQLHGDESADDVASFGPRGVKALPMAGEPDVARLAAFPSCEVLLIDTPTAGYGGSGRSFDWQLARRAVASGRKIVLAGGLDPDNVARAVRDVAPYGVDVASGVESAPGIKDPDLVRRFVEAAKGAA